ncbi:MAG: hypothetical protein PHF37_04065 [Phycisphaerae bacterium]|nr:hypothetical protein [Phycisphaerae bacterium]
MKKCIVLSIVCLIIAGCGGLRFEPSEAAKQNALLHHRTTQAAAQQAKIENSSQRLQGLTELGELQSSSFVGYYGLPAESIQTETVDDILSESNAALAKEAFDESLDRPDGWDITNGTLDMAIGIAALFGGAYGIKALRFLQEAKDKSLALREIVKGNELFKQEHKAYSASFKESQAKQSSATKQIVSQIKSEA